LAEIEPSQAFDIMLFLLRNLVIAPFQRAFSSPSKKCATAGLPSTEAE
jgi:hypothetical protein